MLIQPSYGRSDLGRRVIAAARRQPIAPAPTEVSVTMTPIAAPNNVGSAQWRGVAWSVCGAADDAWRDTATL